MTGSDSGKEKIGLSISLKIMKGASKIASHGFGGVSIVVRESGERTADACCDLLQSLLVDRKVHRVSGRPFSQTLRRSLETGLDLALPWTLCIDADVLVLPELAIFLDEIQYLPPGCFAAQGLVLDKLIPSCRPAGNHLYRTSLIPQALARIPNDALRPETEMIQSMQQSGYGFHQSRRVIGLHDFEQYIRDVFAKAYLHGHKHCHLKDDFMPMWRSLAREDVDYGAAIVGFEAAEQEMLSPRVSRDFTDERFAAYENAWHEKKPLVKVSLETACVLYDQSMSRHQRFPAHARRLQESIDSFVFPRRQRKSLPARVIRILSRTLQSLRNHVRA